MIIAYQDSLMELLPAKFETDAQAAEGFMVMDKNQLNSCFDSLISNQGNMKVWTKMPSRSIVDYLHNRFRFVKAAGGLVTHGDNCLAIYREGHWDLPKGMVEQGESLVAAALREVEEETSIAPLPHPYPIAKTYHIYDKYGGWHLKQTSWYAMQTDQEKTPQPQTEEAITQALWLPRQECLKHLAASYASLRLLAQIIASRTSL